MMIIQFIILFPAVCIHGEDGDGGEGVMPGNFIVITQTIYIHDV